MEQNGGLVALKALGSLPPGWTFHHREGAQWKGHGAPRLEHWLRQSCRGLMALGVSPGDRVAHFGPNLPEMFMADLAAMAIGALGVVLPDGARAEQLPHYLENARPRVLFVHGEAWARRLPDALEGVTLVAYDLGAQAALGERAIPWARFLEGGSAVPEARAEAAREAVRAEDPAFIIYTSGTSGTPKAVVHSHGSYLRLADQMRDEYGLRPGEVVLAFVPLCHMPARLGMLLALAEPFDPWMSPDLSSLAAQLREVRPTFLPGVPRMFEKIRAVVLERAASAPGPAQALFHWALRMGAQHYIEGQSDFPSRLGFGMADALVLSKLRGALGGRVQRALCGGARVDPEVLRFFASLGIVVRETYGMTEVGVICIQPSSPTHFGSVGAPAAGVEVRIGGDGGIAVRSPSALLGHWVPERGVAPATDAEGFFETGDLGRWGEGGDVEILGRRGDVIRTSGGKSVAPAPIEAALNALPLVERAILVGEGQPCPGALIVAEEESVLAWAASRGVDPGPMDTWNAGDAPGARALRAHLEAQIEAAMAPFPSYERVKIFALTPRALTAEQGEVTDSGKTRRHVVTATFADLISGMYRG